MLQVPEQRQRHPCSLWWRPWRGIILLCYSLAIYKSVISRCIFGLYESNKSFVFLSNQLTKKQCNFKLLNENIYMLLTCFLSMAAPFSQLLEISQYKWGKCYFLEKLCISRLWEGQIEEPRKFSDGLWLKAPACLSWFVFVFRRPGWSCLFSYIHPNKLHQMLAMKGSTGDREDLCLEQTVFD